MIDFRVGSEGESAEVVLEKTLAMRHSELINKALDPQKGWKEANERTINLPEESPQGFDIFCAFIKTGHIHITVPGEGGNKAQDKDNDEMWSQLTEAWLLGDRMFSNSFKDAIVDVVLRKLRHQVTIPTTLHQSIHKGSAGLSGMRRLLVNLAVYK